MLSGVRGAGVGETVFDMVNVYPLERWLAALLPYQQGFPHVHHGNTVLKAFKQISCLA